LLPWLWKTLLTHYNLGRRSESLSKLSLGECMNERTEFVIQKYRAVTVHEISPELLDYQDWSAAPSLGG
jgi:hypothetical protein